MHTIKDFENFIYGCKGVLSQTSSDLIKWDPCFSKEKWDLNSFYSNGEMKVTSKLWSEHVINITENAHKSKTNIKHIIYVDNNTVVIQHLKNEIDKMCNTITRFKDDNKMFNCHIMPKNQWFLSLWGLVFGYKKWFDELIGPLNLNIKKKHYEEEFWFKVGLLFATGRAYELYEKHKQSTGVFALITKDLGFKKTDRPYISQTFNPKNPRDSHNIYYNQTNLKQIQNHCIENNIPMVEDFLKKIKPE